MSDLQISFESSRAVVKRLKNLPDDDTLPEMNSYFKQATEGDVSVARPGVFDFQKPR